MSMFFKSETKSVDFSVGDIQSYSRKLQDAVDNAYERYQDVSSWASKILAALDELITVGKENLAICASQLEACAQIISSTEKKIQALVGIVHQLNQTIYQVDQAISNANSAYQRASQQLDRARNMRTGDAEQAKAMRSQAIAAAEKDLSEVKKQLSKLKDKRSRLYRVKCDAEADMSALNEYLSKIQACQTRLTHEKEKISHTVFTAEGLIGKVTDSLNRLHNSFHNDINNALGQYQNATKTALSRAKTALMRMSELNNQYYSDFEQIEITDLDAFMQESVDMAEQIAAAAKRYRTIYRIRDDHSSILSDDVMSQSVALIDSVADAEKNTLTKLKKYADRLDEFSHSLLQYYRSKL